MILIWTLNLILYNFFTWLFVTWLNCIFWCHAIHGLKCNVITPLLYFGHFLLWMTLFFFVVVDTCDEKILLFHQRNVTQMSGCSIIISVWVIQYSTGSYLRCCHFCLDEQGVYTKKVKRDNRGVITLFSETFHSIF